MPDADDQVEPTFPAATTPGEGKAGTFDAIKRSLDEQTWIGRACIEKLPGARTADGT